MYVCVYIYLMTTINQNKKCYYYKCYYFTIIKIIYKNDKKTLFAELQCPPQSCTYTIQTDHISQDNEVS